MPVEYYKETPSQTAGPFLHIGLAPGVAGLEHHLDAPGGAIAPEGVAGERITITGRMLDGVGAPVRDAMIEIWQADPNGIYPHPEDPRVDEVAKGFLGFGRASTSFEDGTFTIETVKPGPVPGRSGTTQAPHLNLWIVARGINIGLHTRMYFADEDNESDPVLNMVEQAVRRPTMIAKAEGDGRYSFDIVLQGENETVFLDV